MKIKLINNIYIYINENEKAIAKNHNLTITLLIGTSFPRDPIMTEI